MNHCFVLGALFSCCLLSSGKISADSPPDASGATAYVEAIYRRIPGRFDYHDVRYASELANLMARDDAISRRSGDEGALDHIPFCDCQDTTSYYRIASIRLLSHRANVASVGVLLHNTKTDSFKIDLVCQAGRWRVVDVHSRRTASLLAFMRVAVANEERAMIQPNRSH